LASKDERLSDIKVTDKITHCIIRDCSSTSQCLFVNV